MKDKKKFLQLIGVLLLVAVDMLLPACATQSATVTGSENRRTQQQGESYAANEPVVSTAVVDELGKFGGW